MQTKFSTHQMKAWLVWGGEPTILPQTFYQFMLESQTRVIPMVIFFLIIISFPSTGIYFYWTDISMICGINQATRESD